MKKMTTEELYSQPEKCCGCEMCAQSCPKDVITMKRDGEGFSYPVISDNSTCISCGLCQKVCPIKSANDIHSSFKKAYAGWANDKSDVISSSSGGLAAILSRQFINNGGVVYAVSYTDNCISITYSRIDKAEDIERTKSSKYAQASKVGILPLIRDDLKAGQKVLFIGVPCDCAGIKNAFKDPPNLFIVSIICHGPTSPLVHKQYCELLKEKYKYPITQFSVRHKKDGQWKPYYIYAAFENGAEHLEKFEDSVYNKAFLFFKRPSCNACAFKKDKFVADLLIGDFHAAKPGTDTYNENGVSSILTLTDRGKSLLEEVGDVFFFKEVDMKISTHQVAINQPVKAQPNRSEFSKVFQSKGLVAASQIKSIKLLETYDALVTNVKKTGVKIKRFIR